MAEKIKVTAITKPHMEKAKLITLGSNWLTKEVINPGTPIPDNRLYRGVDNKPGIVPPTSISGIAKIIETIKERIITPIANGFPQILLVAMRSNLLSTGFLEDAFTAVWIKP